VTDLLKALLGNGSVNTFQHATIGELCFVTRYSTLISITILATGVFCVVRAALDNESVSAAETGLENGGWEYRVEDTKPSWKVVQSSSSAVGRRLPREVGSRRRIRSPPVKT
jgi:hypothetical protein